ncbi:hypothetical protein EXE42_15530, partial [Halorubrum sp. SP3]
MSTSSDTITELTDEMVEPAIDEQYQPAYEGVSALLLPGESSDEFTVTRGDGDSGDDDTPPADPDNSDAAETSPSADSEASPDETTSDESDDGPGFTVEADADAFSNPDADIDPEDIDLL